MNTDDYPWFALPSIDASPNASTPTPENSTLIVGAGLAGCHIASALAKRGQAVTLIDAGSQLASGASANTCGVVRPFITREPSLASEFYATAFNYLLHEHSDKYFQQCGVLQLVRHQYPSNNHYEYCSEADATDIAGTALHSNALYFRKGGWINAAAQCRAAIDNTKIELKLNCKLHSLDSYDNGWLVHTQLSRDKQSQSGESAGLHSKQYTRVILANGHQLSQFAQTNALPLTPARGQTSRFKIAGSQVPNCVITGKHYVAFDGNEALVGATFQRDVVSDEPVRDDDVANYNALKNLLPSLQVEKKVLSNFCAVRATTPDRLPLIGPVPDFDAYAEDYKSIRHGLPAAKFPKARYLSGLHVMGGFGSRGLVSAPYCAELLAQQICGEETDDRWLPLLHPARFCIRDMKRARA